MHVHVAVYGRAACQWVGSVCYTHDNEAENEGKQGHEYRTIMAAVVLSILPTVGTQD